MAPREDLEDVALAIILLRYLVAPHLSQAELSRLSGVDKGLISDYELGLKRPGPRNRRRLAAAVGVEVSFFDQLIPACGSIRLAFEGATGQRRAGAPAEAGTAPGLDEKILGAVREGMAPFLLPLRQRERGLLSQARDRAWAEEKWSKLAALSAEDQSSSVEVLLGDERSWALAERLCLAAESAAGRASEAVRLEGLARRLAEHVSGPEGWRLGGAISLGS